ncbi:MAG: VWD domain-containing protein [Crocinitomicaceae bacterium]|nr:VWD domain-containing protein [Crocinitomicaceae bacterium]
MKTHYAIITLISFTFAFNSIGQDAVRSVAGYESVSTELSYWDDVRGPWLASSLEAMANDQPIPDRNFPEKFTPYQMLKMVPEDTRGNISEYAREQGRTDNQQFWSSIDRYVNSAGCPRNSGRTYGDPHMVSYDGARYSFQTVGEFVLSKSRDGNMEVQTRQQPMGDEFSLNTAVAMDISGDRLAIYARNYPDGNYSTPLRLDGKPIHMNGSTYFLEHGGTIKKSNNDYTVYYPTGETVTVQMRNTRNFDFMNVAVSVSECSENQYSGLFGNNNDIRNDDFNAGGVAPPFAMGGDSRDNDYWKRERLAFMAKQFADVHRITQGESLFDYPMGMNSESFTDRTFPRVFPKPADFNDRRYSRSRRDCQDNGVDQRDMEGCIYDNMNLGIAPSRPPVAADPTEGTVLRPTTGRVDNVNPTSPAPNARPDTPISTPGNTATNGDPGTAPSRPTSSEPSNSNEHRPTTTTRPAQTTTTTTRPQTTTWPTTTTTTRPPQTTTRPPTITRPSTPRPTNNRQPTITRPTTPRPTNTRPSSTPTPSRGGRGGGR